MSVRSTAIGFLTGTLLATGIGRVSADDASNDSLGRLMVDGWSTRREARLQFRRLDRDGDGKLSAAEWRPRRGDQTAAEVNAPVTLEVYAPQHDAGLNRVPSGTRTNVLYKRVGDWLGLMDIYPPTKRAGEPQPEGGPASPVLVFLHGGGWGAGSKSQQRGRSDPRSERELARQAGMTFVAINYRLCKFDGDGVLAADCIADCKDAIRFLKSQSEGFGIDGERIVVLGGSAGGHLAQMVVQAPDDEFPGDASLAGTPASVLGGISYYGFTQMGDPALFRMESVERLRDRFAERTHATDWTDARIAAEEQRISPVRYVTADSRPMLFVQGDADTTVPIEHMLHMQKIATERGAPFTFQVVENVGHGWNGKSQSMSREQIAARTVEFALNLIGD